MSIEKHKKIRSNNSRTSIQIVEGTPREYVEGTYLSVDFHLFENGNEIGDAMTSIKPTGIGIIEYISVETEGKGHGTQLLQHITNYFDKKGIDIELWVIPEHESKMNETTSFYERAGFKIVEHDLQGNPRMVRKAR
jgi:N-acetylglutamate synthase-like GNAT family acetyltransferase